MSIASPSTVPTAAPVSIPPFIAEVITSTSAAARPTEAMPATVTRAKLISTHAAIIIADTLWRSSAVSVVRRSFDSASRKKYAPPKASAVSRNSCA